MPENLELLRRAADEITRLRADNHTMRTRLDMFDNIMTLVNVQIDWGGKSSSPDIVREINSFIEAEKEADRFRQP